MARVRAASDGSGGGAGSGTDAFVEPVAGALHRRRMHCGQRLVAFSLRAPVVAQQAAHLTQHGGGLGAAAVGDGEVAAELAGEAEAVHGVVASATTMSAASLASSGSAGCSAATAAMATSSRVARASGVSVSR